MSTKLERLFMIDGIIRNQSYPGVADLMRRFEVSERTIRADLAFLRDRLGAPLCYERHHQGYTYSDPAWVLPALVMTEGELLAFFLSVELARRYLGTAFEVPLRNAIERMAANQPAAIKVDLGDLTQHYTFQTGAITGADPALLAALLECAHQRWPMQITYFTASRGERNIRLIEPYHLYNVRGDWQVIGFDHLRGQFRNFAVSRIEAWQVLKDRQFTIDPSFSAEDYLRTGFLAERGDTAVEVAIWFDAYQARYIRERQFHPSQQIAEHTDGSLTLRFQSGALAEIRRWVMSFGSHARVLAPASLVEDVAAELRAALERYG